ncbi:hypothetical protein HHK36_029893 [Tetracentron sinense]|uniref:Sulfotransferase n=1 Tax=Tetracentron sinense TaxID=13715 RepID=A0A835D053_TETSI|nr:hypothetical protein HHK36_029893 [Tetracentron sinense]
MTTSMSHSISSATLSNSLDHLPREKWWGYDLHQWEGFWYLPPHIEGAIAARSHFKACTEDVVLASCIKTGTTWLKALIPSIMNLRTDVHAAGDDDNDPLIKNHPNVLMPSLELQLYSANLAPDLSLCHPPDYFELTCLTTHYPNPSRALTARLCTLLGIQRTCWFRWYWKESLKRSQKILFLKYEEMKKEPRAQLKRLASFLERPFVKEEDVDKVLWRLGNVGDWKNNFTTDMKERLNEITKTKLEGSGLDLDN